MSIISHPIKYALHSLRKNCYNTKVKAGYLIKLYYYIWVCLYIMQHKTHKRGRRGEVVGEVSGADEGYV